MKAGLLRFAIVGLMMSCVSTASAQEGEAVRTLPTLLIKGSVESVVAAEGDTLLLKVKDRYGFETPIYLPKEISVTQQGQAREAEELKPGMNVEVEYNFDVNTAKRQGVVVAIADPLDAGTAPVEAAAPAPAAEPAPAAAEPAPEPALETTAAPEAPAEPAAEPAAEEPAQ